MGNLIEPIVRKFIAENLLYQEDGDSLVETDSFLAAGIIDSTGVLELVTFLEDHFHIQVRDEEMIPENLDSIRQLTAYVHRKLGSSLNGSRAHAC